MSSRLLPTGSSPLELAAAEACAEIQRVPVPIKTLVNPDTCPLHLLPYLAWAWSVDRWDADWPERTKRDVIKASMFVHKHKGTIGALRRVVEPLGYLISVTEWWKTGDRNGTFRLTVGVSESGITEETYYELERLIFNAKSLSRHLLGLSVGLNSRGECYTAVSLSAGDEITIYPLT
ncbi:phage tail protein I [Morganella morganii]|uniref:phage tail protein I n=1 Tax=Morganella morganii TaxID=582 RepID=UPI000669486D|nr:phage tail protein I [Morganella morganii]SSN07513.1 putative prophage tail protein [Klebsiella pneumoniae]EJD6109605.1 phage tail protein I [Morganella morganii]EJG2207261.1 phage tail protein I [Morganella morganii]EKU4014220.1 phage tail protein I [Morganella morganii]ELA7703229.1 phage tail protein I [Morganella morganii]